MLSIVETADLVDLGVGVSLLDCQHVVSTFACSWVGPDRVKVDQVESHLTDLSAETGDFLHRNATVYGPVRVPDILRLHEVGVVDGNFDLPSPLAGFRNWKRYNFYDTIGSRFFFNLELLLS